MDKELATHEKIEENTHSEKTNPLETMGEFNREKAEKAIAEHNAAHPKKTESENTTPEALKDIDYSCFDSLLSDDFGSRPLDERKDIYDQCEAAYDASVGEFAKMGNFGDPEDDRYSGGEPHEGMEGAIRAVNVMVTSVLSVDRWREEVAKDKAKLKECERFHLFGRKENEKRKRRIKEDLNYSMMMLRDAQEWPERAGSLAFGSSEKFHQKDVQDKFQHLIQMRRQLSDRRDLLSDK